MRFISSDLGWFVKDFFDVDVERWNRYNDQQKMNKNIGKDFSGIILGRHFLIQSLSDIKSNNKKLGDHSVTFRWAEQQDLDILLDLTRECIRSMLKNGIDQWDDVYPNTNDWRRDIELRTLLLCETNQDIIGCAVLNAIQDPGYSTVDWQLNEGLIGVVHRLMVHPMAQGQGIAKRIMQYLETEAVIQGARAIRLDAFSENAAALALYEKLGYRRAGMVQFRKGLFWCFEKNIMHSAGLL